PPFASLLPYTTLFRSLRVFLRYFSKPSVRVGCRMFSDSQRFLDCGIIAKNHRRINQSFLRDITNVVCSRNFFGKGLQLHFNTGRSEEHTSELQSRENL